MSVRSDVITRRTYNRPLNEEGTKFETWDGTVDRVITHQKWLWENAKGTGLNNDEMEELEELRGIMLKREATVSGRTLWLGGTDVAKARQASNFNCSALEVSTVNDIVDAIWLLMQGCGVGFRPVIGTLNGFSRHIRKVTVLNTTREDKSGEDHNTETWDAENKVWTIRVGDSAEAWAKSFGKLLAGKYPAEELVLDFRAIRPAGSRLKGYGWISSGDRTLTKAMVGIAGIMNERADKLLTRINLLDILNYMGTVLSSRRSAEIAFQRYGDDEWEEFATAKKDYWKNGNTQRAQSNNTLLFYEKPSKMELKGLFQMMLEAGGSEPGFMNAAEAKRRAPWFKLTNPCGEILLGSYSFCNLTDTDLGKFNGGFNELLRTIYIIARANYRQTCVNLRDGILQDTWHELNEYLRLTGVGLTGIVRWEYQWDADKVKQLRTMAKVGVNSMADELGLPRSKATCTIKPSGCNKKDSLLITKDGILSLDEIGDIYGETWQDHSIMVGQEDGYKESTKFFINGFSQTKKILLSSGIEIECTPHHQYRVLDNDGGYVWKTASSINAGDLLPYKVGGYTGGSRQPLITVSEDSFSKNSGKITQPKFIDEDLAYLLGLYTADGSTHDKGIRIAGDATKVDILLKAKDIAQNIFGIDGIVYERTKGNNADLYLNSTRLLLWLKVNGLTKEKTGNIEIPLAIRKSKPSVIHSFIDGYGDGDGSTKTNSRTFCTTSKKMADQLTVVLRALGIDSKMRLMPPTESSLGSNMRYWVSERKGRMSDKRYIRNELIDKWEKLDSLGMEDFSVDTVVEVNDGYTDTYDIEVPDTTTYIANSYVSHNTLSKIMDTTEGVHKPLGKYIFNNVNFGRKDPLIPRLIAAGYRVQENPIDDNLIVTFPVKWDDVEFTEKVVDRGGEKVIVEVNTESAVEQLERYKFWMANYIDHNCSITVSYDPEEVPSIVNWLYDNWDCYVGVSWLLRADPTKSAQDLGYLYLPQEVVTKEQYEEYVSKLGEVILDEGTNSFDEVDAGECSTGACPVR